MIDEMFLAVLSRPATDEDRSDIAEFLSACDDKRQALGQVVWALLASNEFCINH